MPDFRDVFEFTRKMLSGGTPCDDDKWQTVPFELRLRSRGDVPKMGLSLRPMGSIDSRPAATSFLRRSK
jgi:hypothetical protein